eukprot:5650566-Karenia_brevis.AAC.1
MLGTPSGEGRKKEKAKAKVDIIKYCMAANMPPAQLQELLQAAEDEDSDALAAADRYAIGTPEKLADVMEDG